MNKGIEKPKLKFDPELVLIIQTKPGPRNAVDEKYVVGQTRVNFHVISLRLVTVLAWSRKSENVAKASLISSQQQKQKPKKTHQNIIHISHHGTKHF